MSSTRTALRRLGREEMDAAAAVHRKSMDERLPWLAGLHSPEEDRWFYRERMFRDGTVWGAFAGERLVGIMVHKPRWIEQLYVLPGWHRQGIGAGLLGLAKAAEPELHLWTFQRNAGARAFYAAQGFVAVRETDGAENEEREPDVLYRWPA